jgi:hypothetical protein
MGKQKAHLIFCAIILLNILHQNAIAQTTGPEAKALQFKIDTLVSLKDQDIISIKLLTVYY